MAAQKGRLFVFKVGDGGSPETFTTVAGSRNVTFTNGNSLVDITNKDSNGFRTLLADAGTKTLDVTIDGVFTDEASYDSVRDSSFNATEKNYQIIIPTGSGDDTIEGAFLISSFDQGGAFDAEVTYSFSLQSTGAFTLTQA
jgi:TP901-1 family phage major tail protein